jgi:hypothetical protein
LIEITAVPCLKATSYAIKTEQCCGNLIQVFSSLQTLTMTFFSRFCNIIILVLFVSIVGKAQKQEYYEIRVYSFSSSAQEAILDDYLTTALIPAMHKNGSNRVGVFKAIANDTAAVKKLYLFTAAPSLDKLAELPLKLRKDSVYARAARPYLNAEYNKAPFSRIETILLKAFPLAPKMKLPALKAPRKDRIYELRSYESPTEKLYASKVKMFNEGGEISLFQRLAFNAVFYADVLSGSRMPNLMYMTSFENRTERDALWEKFRQDEEWRRISALPEYQRNVSKAEIILLRATDYSDF